MSEPIVCPDCNGCGLKPPKMLFKCSTCVGVGPFHESYPGQPAWRAGETHRYVGNTKIYRSYDDYVD